MKSMFLCRECGQGYKDMGIHYTEYKLDFIIQEYIMSIQQIVYGAAETSASFNK